MFKLKIDDSEITYGNEVYILQRLNDKKYDFKTEMILSYNEERLCVINKFDRKQKYDWYVNGFQGDEDYILHRYSQHAILQKVVDGLTVSDYLEYGNKVVTAHA